jgi:hypothetical protein
MTESATCILLRRSDCVLLSFYKSLLSKRFFEILEFKEPVQARSLDCLYLGNAVFLFDSHDLVCEAF